jgi:hypothetical protein
MQAPSNDALLDQISRQEFDAVVRLYDRFAHSDNPFDLAAYKAEATFNENVQWWFDAFVRGKCPFQDFRKAVIKRCKLQIIKESKNPPSVS